MSDSTKPFLDKLKDLADSRKSLQLMKNNIDEHVKMIRKELSDITVARELPK
jgi:hypothetical protein